MLHPSCSPWAVCRGVVCCLVFALVTSPALAQAPKATTKAAVDISAISGLASTGKHCVSGMSSKVHGLGWIAQGSAVTITFLSDFDPIAGVVSLDIEFTGGRGGYLVDDDSGGNLEPRFQYTATSSGNVALYVSGYRSTSGCYWYKLEVTPPQGVSTEVLPPAPLKETTVQPAAVTGLPSISYHCIAGAYVANVHTLGRVSANSRVTITFDTDFDAMAGLVNLDLFAASPQARFTLDDDSGGRLAPQISGTLSEAGTVALFVGGYRATAGCYRFKVEIQ